MDDKTADKTARGKKWVEEIQAALKRDDSWIKDAEAAETAYTAGAEDRKGEVPRFNIHHSNVETIVPAVFNSTPVPDIRAKVENDQVGRMVAQILEKSVAAQTDDNALDIEIEAAALDAYSTGRGLVRVAFEADEVEETALEPAVDEFGQPILDEAGMPAFEEITYTSVKNERVVFKVVSWRDYVEGPTARFSDVPWVAYKHQLTDEAMEDMGLEIEPVATDEEDGECETTTVWEVWCKKDRTVHFIRETDGRYLREVMEDPLGLAGFFPSPRPMQPIEVASKRLPISPYRIYREQAMELEKVTRRIDSILSGIKVAGIVVGDASDIAELANAEDNTLIPISNVEAFAHTGGLDKAIVWWPFDKAVMVLRELYTAREQIKQLIYEITGISDIVRGASQTAETATAQQIKTQWGSLRVKKLQRLVERHVRDAFVLASEIIAGKFSAERLGEITGAQIPQEVMQVLEAGIQQYRIDIESDSTVRADLSRMKGEMEGFLNGTAQFFSTMGPIVAQERELGAPVMQLYQAFANQFNMGKQAQEALEQMAQIVGQGGKQEGPTPEQQAQQAEMQAQQQAMQAEQQAKQAEMQIKMQADQQKAQMDMQRFQLDVEKTKAELQLKQQQLADARDSKAVDAQVKQLELQIKQADLALKEKQVALAAIQGQQELEIEREQRRPAKIGNE